MVHGIVGGDRDAAVIVIEDSGLAAFDLILHDRSWTE